jgi:hypothetical protein
MGGILTIPQRFLRRFKLPSINPFSDKVFKVRKELKKLGLDRPDKWPEAKTYKQQAVQNVAARIELQDAMASLQASREAALKILERADLGKLSKLTKIPKVDLEGLIKKVEN